MKNKISIKTKLTIVYTLLMAFIVVFSFIFLVVINSTVNQNVNENILKETLKANIKEVSLIDGKPNITDKFLFSNNGVNSLIYSSSNTLLAGQVPVNFKNTDVEFQNGIISNIDSNGYKFLVMDYRILSGFDNYIWLRGIKEVPPINNESKNLIVAYLIVMPLLIIICAFFGKLLANQFFKPIDAITSTVKEINSGNDLSKRVNLNNSDDEFGKLAKQFDNMLDKLQDSFTKQKQFVSDASHELRTPISVIIAAIDYENSYKLDEQEIKDNHQIIYRASTNMSNLVNQLLDLSRLDQDNYALNKEIFSLSEVIMDVCSAYNNINFIYSLSDININADKLLIRRVIENLISNAYKYGKEKANIWIETKIQDDKVVIAIKDDGIGIPQDKLDKIFDRFYQVDPSRNNKNSSGLGLALVKQIINLHNGEIHVDSTVNVGTTFTISLPNSDVLPLALAMGI